MPTNVAANSGRITFIANNDLSNSMGLRNKDVASRQVADRAKAMTISMMLRRIAKRISCSIVMIYQRNVAPIKGPVIRTFSIEDVPVPVLFRLRTPTR